MVTKRAGFVDYFELALLLGACFLVNYVTADAKTNWVEVSPNHPLYSQLLKINSLGFDSGFVLPHDCKLTFSLMN